MAAVSLTKLMTRARNRADKLNDPHVGDDELVDYINEGAKRLHELVVGAYGEDYVKKESAFTTVSGQRDYPLPSDFFKLTGVDLTVSNKAIPLKRFMEPERDAYRNVSTVSWLSVPRYKLEGNNLRLYPAPSIATPGTIIYIPLLQVLVGGVGSTYVNEFTTANTADTIDFPNGWEKFVTLYAAIEMLDKEESQTKRYQEKLDKWEAELVAMAENRDAANAKVAVDHDLEELDPRWW